MNRVYGRSSGGFDSSASGKFVRLNQIDAERLLKVWPVAAVPRTRLWFAENVGQGQLSDVQATLRLEPGVQPQFNLAYEFADT